jgi:hypothetical protein
VTYVVGCGISPGHELPEGHRVVRAPAGLPCTGVWSALAAGLPDWSVSGGRVVVADYDRALRYLNLCVVDTHDSGGAQE